MRKKHCSIGGQRLLEPIRVEAALCHPDPSKLGLGAKLFYLISPTDLHFTSVIIGPIFSYYEALTSRSRLKQVGCGRTITFGFHADCIWLGAWRGQRERSFFSITQLSPDKLDFLLVHLLYLLYFLVIYLVSCDLLLLSVMKCITQKEKSKKYKLNHLCTESHFSNKTLWMSTQQTVSEKASLVKKLPLHNLL